VHSNFMHRVAGHHILICTADVIQTEVRRTDETCPWSLQRALYRANLATLPLPVTCTPAQVSAVGVWGTPIDMASRAADIVAAFPTAQLLCKGYQSRRPSCVHGQMLLLIQEASKVLTLRHVSLPYHTREQLEGKCDMSLILQEGTQ
jgi:hypothetical protein